LKSVDQYQLVGSNLPRTDIAAKSDGSAIYTQDFKLPGMLTALVAHAPRYGAVVKTFDGRAAKAVKGVVDVLIVPTGVAVVANDFWSAHKGRELLAIEWDESNAFTLGSDEIMQQFKALAEKSGPIAREVGSTANALKSAVHVHESEFEFPYLSHATMEPLNCIVQISDGGCEMWYGAQQQTTDQANAAEILGISPEQVKINMLYAGGSFGRRACSDYTREALHVAKALGGTAPVKLVWTREDDMQAGMFRPLNFHRISAGLDIDGNIIAWHHRLVGQSIALQHVPAWMDGEIDSMSVGGADDFHYSMPNIKIESHSPDLPVPVLWYRGVAGTHAVFAVEVFLDELAAVTGKDPVDFRREMLAETPRMLGVLDLVAQKSDWSSVMESGRGRGISLCEQRGSYMAQVAEVTVHADESYSVDRVITAIDCGLALNPEVITAQIEGGTGFGLSSTIGDEITLKNGFVEQSNFDRYRVLRIDQMPDMEVHTVDSAETPTGLGDLSSIPIAAAVANALTAATGKVFYRLPTSLTA
jgi:isoquinoline 1-oxidoreductase beta subunit